ADVDARKERVDLLGVDRHVTRGRSGARLFAFRGYGRRSGAGFAHGLVLRSFSASFSLARVALQLRARRAPGQARPVRPTEWLEHRPHAPGAGPPPSELRAPAERRPSFA